MQDAHEAEPTPAEPVEAAEEGLTLEELQAQVEKLNEDNEALRELVRERNHEAASRRVEAKANAAKAKTLEEQVQELQAAFQATQRESALNKALAEHGLTVEDAVFLGDDPEQFAERAKLFKSRTATPAPADPKPVGVERLKGGLEPGNQAEEFDPQTIIRRHRAGR